jgi:hypothetical protein
MSDNEVPWWNRPGVNVYIHPESDGEALPGSCLLNFATGTWHTLLPHTDRPLSHPCLLSHAFAERQHTRQSDGFAATCVRDPDGQRVVLRATASDDFLTLWDDGLGTDAIPCPGRHGVPEVIRYPHSLRLPREAMVQQPDLMSMLSAEMMRPGTIDWGEPKADPPSLADAVRASAHEAMTARYEPTGLILHPLDHALVGIDPDNPKSIETAKRVADSFGVPYWAVGIPGYRAPLWRRVRAWVRRVPRRALTALPLVERPGRRYTGPEWFGETRDPRAGRWFIHIGYYRVGSAPTEQDC